MGFTQEGKICMLLLLLLSFSSFMDFCKVFVSCDDPLSENHQVVPDSKPEDMNTDVHDSSRVLYQAQIDKLEQIVRNLSELVAKLESRFHESNRVESLRDTQNFVGKDKVDSEERIGTRAEDEELKGKDFRGLKMGSVTKYSPFWSERFQFVSAVNLESAATCLEVLPFRDYEGLSKYVAVGDDRGRVYLFLRNGDVLVEYSTSTDSRVTAMLSYMSVYKNESFLVTGHGNGKILIHRLWESVIIGEEWSQLHMENVLSFDSVKNGENGSPVTILEVHHVGRSRYILSADDKGQIKVFKENGTLNGLAVPTSRPLAFLKQRLLFLTETGAGSLDLRTMKIKEIECEGLNHSLAKTYAIDATERSKAYGFTSAGDLIHVLLLGDIMNFKCRVRSRRKLDMDVPLAFQAIKGYLLIVGQEMIYVYNVSSQHYVRSGVPRLLFSAGIEEIKSSFLSHQAMNVDAQGKKMLPLVASDREKLVVLGLGGGCVGMYRSKLPVAKGESNTMLWTSPVLFFILFLFGAWQFFAKKKEALTSWGPDEPFTSTTVTSRVPIGSGSGDRSFTEPSSRSADIMDLRSNGLRGTSRRYPSPSRYPGGAADSFRPSAVDTNSRTSVDPSFRTASELKFRGPSVDSTSFPKRREQIYVNGEIVDDSCVVK